MDPTTASLTELDVEHAVTKRYSAASQTAEKALCCSVKYEPQYLKVLPQELIDRDYGCGDPSRFVREGETVLDLGSGGGKVCYIASQIVGPNGRVIGVDMNNDMLDLALRHQAEIARRIGWGNVEFRKGRIQDLGLDLEKFDKYLREHPVRSANDWLVVQRHAETLRRESPMVATNSIDVVLSNCVLNLVQPADRQQLFAEIFRVLKPGGRAVISDIVSSVTVPERLRNDPELWSGCISGAFEEGLFIKAFEEAGFIGLRVVDRQQAPWTVVDEIEFRSLTVQAFKPVACCTPASGDVIYRGPWKRVIDDSGIELLRGQRMTVSGDCLARLTAEPYSDQIIAVDSDKTSLQAPTLLPVTNCCQK